MTTLTCWLAVAFAAVLLNACSDDDTDTLTAPSLTWRSCTDAPAIQCATLKVPMD